MCANFVQLFWVYFVQVLCTFFVFILYKLFGFILCKFFASFVGLFCANLNMFFWLNVGCGYFNWVDETIFLQCMKIISELLNKLDWKEEENIHLVAALKKMNCIIGYLLCLAIFCVVHFVLNKLGFFLRILSGTYCVV